MDNEEVKAKVAFLFRDLPLEALLSSATFIRSELLPRSHIHGIYQFRLDRMVAMGKTEQRRKPLIELLEGIKSINDEDVRLSFIRSGPIACGFFTNVDMTVKLGWLSSFPRVEWQT
ncbi:MAG: hypothetical protein IT229_01245 [Flavobacteriales bacterium]|nr:hypothetical protein [Flavobacteriales bacterium]